jgi:thiaminase
MSMVLIILMLNFHMTSNGLIKRRQCITLDLPKNLMLNKPCMTFTNHTNHIKNADTDASFRYYRHWNLTYASSEVLHEVQTKKELLGRHIDLSTYDT